MSKRLKKNHTRRIHNRISVDLMKRVEAEALEKGISYRDIIESAIKERYEPSRQPSRDAVIARRLNRIDNRIKVVERQQEILMEYLGLFIRMWFMANDEIPPDKRKKAFEQSSRRFEALTVKVEEQINTGKALISSLPKELKR